MIPNRIVDLHMTSQAVSFYLSSSLLSTTRIQSRKYVIHIKGLILLIIISVRQIILKGGAEYPITPKRLPVYLYEDPQNYSAHDILGGFLRGKYLLKVCH